MTDLSSYMIVGLVLFGLGYVAFRHTKTLTRYVIIELVKVFIVSMVGLTSMMMIVGVIKEGADQHLPMSGLVRLIPYILPNALRWTIPATLLLATTTVYARMAAFNEVVAIKALGVSPWAILRPAYVLAFLLSLLTVWMNDLEGSWGRHGAQRVVTEAIQEIVYNMLRTQKSFSSERLAINVKRVEGQRLIRVNLALQGRGKTPSVRITAEEAEIYSDPANNVLRIVLRNGTINVPGRGSFQFPDEHEQDIPLSDRDPEEYALPSWMPLHMIPEKIVAQARSIELYRQDMAMSAALQMATGDFVGLTSPDWSRRELVVHGMRNLLSRMHTEPYRRWSQGFSCLFFVWVGAPLAMHLRNGDLLTSFFLCFLPILVVYFPLLFLMVDMAKNGGIPPWSVWAGNVLLFLAGTWLLRKVIRY